MAHGVRLSKLVIFDNKDKRIERFVAADVCAFLQAQHENCTHHVTRGPVLSKTREIGGCWTQGRLLMKALSVGTGHRLPLVICNDVICYFTAFEDAVVSKKMVTARAQNKPRP